jgi:hypothetical protein
MFLKYFFILVKFSPPSVFSLNKIVFLNLCWFIIPARKTPLSEDKMVINE